MKLVALFCLLCLLVPTSSTYGQSTNATISGIIVDPSGRVIPSVKIEVLSDLTGYFFSTESNHNGIYALPLMPPGHYRIQVSRMGFKTLIKPDVVLNVQSAVTVNFTMPPGSASESVTVEAGASTLNTTDATVSTVIDRKFVENMPLNGRSFQDLISMTPGVVTQSPQQTGQFAGTGGDFSVNGQRTESNYYTVDGVAANNAGGYATGSAQSATGGTVSSTTALGTTQSLISVDALQEFRVQSSSYSAEYGRSPGGQFSFATRSGTNAFHGTIFDYFRNDFFDANDWFNDHVLTRKSPLRQNDFGATTGGPITVPSLYSGKDRSFFFASYEGLRLTQPRPAIVQYVPDTFMRQQADPSLRPILDAFPIQSGTDYGTVTAPNMAQFIKPYSLPSSIDAGSLRLDHNFGRHLVVFVRYSNTESKASSRVLSVVNSTSGDSQSWTLGASSQLSNHITNEFRLGYSTSNANSRIYLDGFGGATPTNLTQDMGVGGYSNPYAFLSLEFAAFGTSTVYTSQTANLNRQWNLVDSVTFALGSHQIKTGIDFRRISSPLVTATPRADAAFLTPMTTLANRADVFYIYKYAPANPIFNDVSAYVQDEWRINHRLSLSTGIRWEVAPPPHDANGNDAYTLQGNLTSPQTLTLAPQGTPLWKTSYWNFAPRLGLAWSANRRSGWETVVRAGGGAFFDTLNEVGALGFNGVGFVGFRGYSNVPVTATSDQLNFSISPVAPYTGSTVYYFSPHLQLPYTLEWNTAVEQRLGSDQKLSLTYIGSNGRRLVAFQDETVTASNPNFGLIAHYQSNITSNYQALQVAFQRTVSHGLQALGSYTWSHSIDFASNSGSIPLRRGDSNYDVRDNFQLGLTWDIPDSIRAPRPLQVLSRNWGLDTRFLARSGFPIVLQGSTLVDGAGNYYYSGLNLIPSVPLYLYGAQYPGGHAINPVAFALPATGGNGNAPRGVVRGFGENQVNMALRRQFPIAEHTYLLFRAEAFNIFNHPNFGYVNPTLGQITFGQATQMLNQSLGTVASQFQQGGPRSMQFALKLSF